MVEAMVEFDYEAVNPDELSIKVGDTITKVNMMDGGWWEGEFNGKRGMFPDNFVKKITKEDSSKSHFTGPPPTVNGQTPVDEVIKRENSTQKKKMRAKVTYSYAPQNEDEIHLELDTEIEITSQPEPGWWEGIVNGKKGMFPSNFVELLQAEEEKPDEAKLVKPKPIPKGTGFGDIFKNIGTPKLKPVVSGHPPSKTVEAPSRSDTSKSVRPLAVKRNSIMKGTPSTAESADSGGKDKAIVEYDYDPKNPDELQLKKGTTITIISKDVGDKGWWKGEKDGRIGVFPDNFVKLLPLEAEAKKGVPPTRPGLGPKVPEQKRTSVKVEERKPPIGGKAVLPGFPRVKPRTAPEPKPKPSPSQDEPDVFGDIKPSTNKLTHPTKDRPKVDNKRPPSNIGLGNENANESSPVSTVKSPSSSIKSTNAGSVGGAVSGQATNELKNDMKALRTEMANLKRDLKKEMDNLVQELDEEKKLRMSMQVELDRVKRMLKN